MCVGVAGGGGGGAHAPCLFAEIIFQVILESRFFLQLITSITSGHIFLHH